MKRKTPNNFGTRRRARNTLSKVRKLPTATVTSEKPPFGGQGEPMPNLDPPVDFRMGPADVVTITYAGRVVATMTLDKRVNVTITGPVTVEVEKLSHITDQAREALRDG